MTEDIKKEEICSRLEEVEDGLRELKEAVEKLTVVCSRMNNHISFVEETYDKMKHPLNYMVEGCVGGGWYKTSIILKAPTLQLDNLKMTVRSPTVSDYVWRDNGWPSLFYARFRVNGDKTLTIMRNGFADNSSTGTLNGLQFTYGAYTTGTFTTDLRQLTWNNGGGVWNAGYYIIR